MYKVQCYIYLKFPSEKIIAPTKIVGHILDNPKEPHECGTEVLLKADIFDVYLCNTHAQLVNKAYKKDVTSVSAITCEMINETTNRDTDKA